MGWWKHGFASARSTSAEAFTFFIAMSILSSVATVGDAWVQAQAVAQYPDTMVACATVMGADHTPFIAGVRSVGVDIDSPESIR